MLKKFSHKKLQRCLLGGLLLPVLASLLPAAHAHEGHDHGDHDLVVYTNRKEDLLKPLLAEFAKKNKVNVRTYYGGDSLIERIKQEGPNSPADIVITQNIAMVQQLKDAGFNNPIPSSVTKGIPKNFVDSDNLWTGVSYRARIIVIAKNSPAQEIVNMKQLADPKWRGQICMRDGLHPYNLGLFSGLHVYMNDSQMKDYLKKLKSNLVQKPSGVDRDQIKLVYSGQCNIAVVNSYYYGLLKKDVPDLESKTTPRLVSLVGDKVGEGIATNISGVAIMKNSKRKQRAEQLAQFLLTPSSQEYFMTKNNEYPVSPAAHWQKNLISLNGKKFTSDDKAMVEAYKFYPLVIKALLSVNFNDK